MTVKELLAQDYSRVENSGLMALVKTRHVSIRDLVTGELYSVTRPTGYLGKNESISKSRPDNPGGLLSTTAVARAPNLIDTGEYTVEGDYIVVRDEIRKYRVEVFRKGDLIYGARDVDNGKVYFQIVSHAD